MNSTESSLNATQVPDAAASFAMSRAVVGAVKPQFKTSWASGRVHYNEGRAAVAKLLRGNRRAGRVVKRESFGYSITGNGAKLLIQRVQAHP